MAEKVFLAEAINGNVTLNPYYVYNGGWDFVLRCTDKQKANSITRKIIDACNNEHVRCNNNDRYGFYVAMHMDGIGGEPKNITVDCNTDSACLVSTIAMSEGFSISRFTYSGSIKQQLLKVGGWECLNYDRFLISSDYLLKGDILVADGKHVAVCTVDGARANANAGDQENVPATECNYVGRVIKNVPVRTGPGVNHTISEEWPSLAEGNIVDVCDSQNGWLYIKIADKYFGWVYNNKIEEAAKSNDFKFEPYLAKITEMTSVKVGPGLFYQKLSEYPTVPQDKVVTVNNIINKWALVRIDNTHVGYIYLKYLEDIL